MDKIKFNNGKLTILQISDAQDLQWVRKTMVKMLNNACDIIKPDLVVFTGDNILGNHINDYRFSSGKRNLTREAEYSEMKKALDHVLSIPEKRKIPFCAIYGNHDDMNIFTKDEQGDIIRSYSMNRGFDTTGDLCGTYRLPVYSSDGENQLMNLWLIDTARHDKKEDKCYQEITKAQADWFKAESESEKAKNGNKAFDSLMFMHIPLEACVSFMEECSENEATAKNDGKFYKKAKGVHGFLHEHITPVEDNFGFYNAVLADGGVRGIVSGHDHKNCFTAEKDDIKFVATPTASFRCYGDRLRGVRVFEIYENNPSDFYTHVYYYSDLCGDNFISDLRWFWDADEYEKKKAAFLAGSAIGAAALAGAGIALKLLRGKK